VQAIKLILETKIKITKQLFDIN